MDSDGGPIYLQNKVQFDIRFNFCRRGRENMHLMKKAMFKVRKDYKTDHKYVCKIVDEATKNHRETDQPIQTNYMMENKGDKMCPVRSFKMYIAHLNPNNEFLWQTPNYKPKNIEDPVWYSKGHIGKNTLGMFMSELSKDCNLSQRYTNHCIRVTGTSILSRCRYNDKEVMSMTGHKSVQSLTVYHRVQDKKKMEMGQVLGNALVTTDEELLQQILPAQHELAPAMMTSTITSPQKAIEPPVQQPNIGNENNILLSYEPNFDEDIDGTDWLKLLCEVEDQNRNLLPMPLSETLVNNCTVTQRNSPMFSNCKIGNININIQKK